MPSGAGRRGGGEQARLDAELKADVMKRVRVLAEALLRHLNDGLRGDRSVDFRLPLRDGRPGRRYLSDRAVAEVREAFEAWWRSDFRRKPPLAATFHLEVTDPTHARITFEDQGTKVDRQGRPAALAAGGRYPNWEIRLRMDETQSTILEMQVRSVAGPGAS
jgi:hypothetical protein